MTVMITGASGYVGFALMQKLIEEGHTVHVLIRNPERAHEFVHERINVFYGDLNNKESLLTAMYGCQQVYHVAGSTDIWVKKPGDSIRINYYGTINVYEAAILCNIKRVVFTSSAGIMGPSYSTPLTEESPRVTAFDIEYELSKKMAEDISAEYIKKGLEIVIVRPTKVFGGTNSTGRFHFMKYIRNFLKYQVVVIPGPKEIYANFCFVEDVAHGHIQAMKHGASGEMYILGGANISYWQFFNLVRNETGIRAYIIKMPERVIKFSAYVQQALYYLLRIRPIYTPKSVKIAFSDHICSSNKAIKEIGYSITPIKDAIVQTIRSIKPSTK